MDLIIGFLVVSGVIMLIVSFVVTHKIKKLTQSMSDTEDLSYFTNVFGTLFWSVGCVFIVIGIIIKIIEII